MHHELLSYSATQPNTGAAAAAVTGDSLTIKNGKGDKKGAAIVLANWGFQQVAGFQQISFPSGHDTTRGDRFNVSVLDPTPRCVIGQPLVMEAQELLTITIAGSNTAGDVELGCLHILYPDLPGVDGRYTTWERAINHSVHLTTVSATLTGAATGYTGTELINAESDLLRANTDYAVMGMETNTACAAIFIVGPDTGFCRIPVPGSTNPEWTCGYFGMLSRAYDRPLIPVINSGNRNSTTIGFLQNENNVSPLVTLHLAELQ